METATATEPLTILGFFAENVRRLQVVEFQPSPTGLVIISGRNGHGKTSVLDTIEMVLGGADHIPTRAVRKGQDKAVGELDLGEYTVRRTVTAEGGGSLVVRNKQGAKQESPQQILDGLLGRLSFDPLDFAKQKPDKRSEILRALLGLDFTGLDQERQQVYDQRTSVNRAIKSAEARLSQTPVYEGLPAEEMSAAPILDQQSKALATNAENQKARAQVDYLHSCKRTAVQDHTRMKKQAEDLKEEIERLSNKLRDVEKGVRECELRRDSYDKQLSEAAAKAETLVDVKVDQFGTQLRELESSNAKIRANKERANLAGTLKASVREADKLTSKIDAIDRQKRDAIAGAKWPIPGLGLNETNEVVYNGIPFDGCSTAEQVRISVAMGLALNPTLKVLLVRQGNDLDEENLLLVAQQAKEAGAQIWLERVDPSGQPAVIIEDGAIKNEKAT